MQSIFRVGESATTRQRIRKKALPMALQQKKVFKYPSEDECLVRRLGSGVLAAWPALPPEVRETILAEAALAWDREYNVAQLPQKMQALIQRYPAKLA